MLENHLEQERIVSLRRTIQKKREELGLNVDVLDLKGLKKFGNLQSLTYPKSLSNFNYYPIGDVAKEFNAIYIENLTIGKHRHIYFKMADEVAKKVYFDLNLEQATSPEEKIRIVQDYLKNETTLPMIEFEVETEPSKVKFLKDIFYERAGKSKPQTFFKFENGSLPYYTTFDVIMPDKVEKAWKNRKGQRAAVRNIVRLLAVGLLLKTAASFVFKNEENRECIKQKLQQIATFELEVFDQLTEEQFLDCLTTTTFVMPDFYKSIIVFALEEMLHDGNEIRELEKRLTSLTTGYAKTFMTKKNIPLKIQNFMKDNYFLNMFGEVEADELCDLEKLNKLAQEFITLSNQLFLPLAKDHSLRFRRLGQHKAAGIYYPGFNTLAVDIDSAHSFVHECFHLIDFQNNLLSVNADFKPLLNHYREIMDQTVNKFGKDHEVYKGWYHSKSKYSRSYFISNEEAFARMGEIYVSDILKIDSSFNKAEPTSLLDQVVYPKDSELLAKIEEYYSRLFEGFKKNQTQVQFKTPKVTVQVTQKVAMKKTRSTQSKPVVKPYEPYRVVEQLSLAL